MKATDADPILVMGMRRFPTGDVRHVPGHGIGMSGMSTVGFLAEYDQALAVAYQRGFTDGYAIGQQDAATDGASPVTDTLNGPLQPVSEPSPRETGRSGLPTWAERDVNNVTDEMETA